MSNKNNDAEKAIIQLGKIFKIFVVVAVVLIIALCIYLASNADSTESKVYSANYNVKEIIRITSIELST